MRNIGDNTLIACSGEYSDFQSIYRDLDELVIEDMCADDGNVFEATEIHGTCEFLHRTREDREIAYKYVVAWSRRCVGVLPSRARS
jgi:hypothetical protein